MQTTTTVHPSDPTSSCSQRVLTAPPLTLRRALGAVLGLWAAVAVLLAVAVLVILQDLYE